MLSPIKPIKHTISNKYNLIQSHASNPIGSDNSYGNFYSIYNSNSISFAHFMGIEGNKDKASDPYYFNLPKIELSDGTIHQFTPDKSQTDCAQKLLKGDSVLYCAPTGTGKTAVAHFAVRKNLDEGKKTIITVPLVALANDKYREFCRDYGKENVGIMTGDRKINQNAPIVIMTTEILYNQSQELKDNPQNIGTIVFDEAHYISDEDRGAVWENSIIAAIPNNIQILCLSATIGNSDEFAKWVQNLNTGQTSSLVELKPKERFVPLIWQVYRPKEEEKFTPVVQYKVTIEDIDEFNLEDKQRRALNIIYQTRRNKSEFYEPTPEQLSRTLDSLRGNMQSSYDSLEEFEEDFAFYYPNFPQSVIKEIAQLLKNEDTKFVKQIYSQSQPQDDFPTLVSDMKNMDMLPALIFKLSRAQCDDIVKNLSQAGVDLTSDEEKEQIRAIIDEYSKTGYLGNDINYSALINGYASHHAGKLPQYRKLVEELFSKKLIKVVSATSTLSAGINMPARTVVISNMTYKRYNAHTKEMETQTLNVNDFHQMAGRAGRRGVDAIGNVVLYNLKAIPNKYKKEEHNKNRIDELNLAYQYIAEAPDKLRSQYRPEAVLLARYYNEHSDNSNLRDMINQSFKMSCAKEKDKTMDAIIQKFENYSHTLLKQGFLYKDYHNEYILTPKGKLLLSAQGANPLMVVSLIYDEALRTSTPETLAQVAGYIAGSDETQEVSGMDEVLDKMLELQLKGEKNPKAVMKASRNIRQTYLDKEDKLLRSLKESKVPPHDIIASDSISGYIVYLWAHMNKINPYNPIENFEKLSSREVETDNKDIKRSLDAKLSQGNIYRVISHSVSVLKQIERICDAALADSENYPDIQYYEKLKAQAKEALELIYVEPISIEDSV